MSRDNDNDNDNDLSSPLTLGERPYEPEWFGHQPEHYFRKIRPGIEEFPWGTLEPAQYDPMLIKQAQLFWTEASFNEYGTAVAFTQLIQALLEVNAPVDLMAMASDFLADEMLHVELTARLASELGGGANCQIDFTQLKLPLDPTLSPMQKANELIIRICCVGEAFSLPMLAGSMKNATHPLVKRVFQQIVKDEALHGRLGFLYLEWADEFIDDQERTRLGHCVEEALTELSPLWLKLQDKVFDEQVRGQFNEAEIHQLGWLLPYDYSRLAEESVHREVLTPLSEFEIYVSKTVLSKLFSFKTPTNV